jgi:hypothetical protein
MAEHLRRRLAGEAITPQEAEGRAIKEALLRPKGETMKLTIEIETKAKNGDMVRCNYKGNWESATTTDICEEDGEAYCPVCAMPVEEYGFWERHRAF